MIIANRSRGNHNQMLHQKMVFELARFERSFHQMKFLQTFTFDGFSAFLLVYPGSCERFTGY
jgi:hypothetical protein